MNFVYWSFALTCLLSSPVGAVDFYLKFDETNVIKTPIELETNSAEDIQFLKPESLQRFLLTDQNLPQGWIEGREPTDIEKAIEFGMGLVTSLLFMSQHEYYDLNSELTLAAMRGVMFFLIPFEEFFLYAHCENDSYLVATTIRPTEDSLKRLKTLKEVKSLCKTHDSSEEQPKDPS